MTYIFFLGNHPGLSIAEILAYFRRKNLKIDEYRMIFEGVILVKTLEKLDVRQLIAELGGTIKIGELMGQLKGDTETSVKQIIAELLTLSVERYHFGFSAYGVRISKNLGLDIKRQLISLGHTARWVVSREPILSSVVVEQNKLLTHGYEFSFIKSEGKIMLIKTLAVQPFKALSKRDYGRPGRDDESGMLPPKLAVIMLNLGLVSDKKVLLDPFCGSGTVVSEAMLMGVRNIFGSDISDRAVDDTKLNVDWLKNKFLISDFEFSTQQQSAVELTGIHQDNSIDAIVTEPYLGPQRGNYDVGEVVQELERLYTKAIIEFYKILKPGGRVVMIWPVFKTNSDRVFISAKIAGQFKIVRPLPDEFKGSTYNLTNRNGLLYGRAGQRVWREILVLEKE